MDLNYVRFDVGHYLHVCHKTTIEKYPNSSFINYIKPEFDKRKSGLDYIVIDRDGKHFGTILNFMRDERSLRLSNWTRHDITDLMTEADYYCLTELVELCDQQLTELDRHESVLRGGDDGYQIPRNRKVEMLFDSSDLNELLRTCRKRVIIASFTNIRRYRIESWLEKLVKLSNFAEVDFYCLASDGFLSSSTYTAFSSTKFILAIFDPNQRDFVAMINPPPDEKFRSKRYRYKVRLYAFCIFADKVDLTGMLNNLV